MNEKFVLCRPKGGVNDTLCQVEKCWQYAENFNRTLIVDTCKSGLKVDFDLIFENRLKTDKVIFKLDDDTLIKINEKTCYPREIEGRLGDYQSVYISGNNFWDPEANVKLTFDFKKDYTEEVVVHDQCGGGLLSFKLLNRVRLIDHVSTELYKRLSKIGDDYYAIHVRNTDHKTDYPTFFKSISRAIENKTVLICSDDVNVIHHAKRFFKESNIVSISEIPDTNGEPLHGPKTVFEKEMKENIAIISIIDLLALAMSKKIFFTQTTKGHISGFTRLAKEIHHNKTILDTLLPHKISPDSDQFPSQFDTKPDLHKNRERLSKRQIL